ncbi:MAG: response regulator [Bdellovibrionaceae bacterium]|nr:response regulator [Pseudobdellovibrionaceae bacterium]
MGANILVVDDQPEMRFLIAANLRRLFNFQIVETDSVQSAIKHLQSAKFELIVSDLIMPNGSGIDLFNYVEENPEFDGHFILFTSAVDRVPPDDKERVIVIDKRHMPELLSAIEFLGLNNGR